MVGETFGSTSKNKDYQKDVKEIKKYFEMAKSYYQNNTEIDIELELMKGLFDGKKFICKWELR